MPELPEVQTIVGDLNQHAINHNINKVQVAPGYNVKPETPQFIEKTVGKKILGVSRIAKNILIHLDSGESILIHLAMTGRIILETSVNKNTPWQKVKFYLTHQNKEKSLSFADMRMFGKVMIINKEDINKLNEKYGPEPLNQNIDPSEFLRLIKSKRSNIKNVLLDQSIVSGLGNIYATDTLFLAKIHPETQTHEINDIMASKILNAAKLILNEGIQHRGSTLPDRMYVDIFGQAGTHQHHFRIYMKEYCPNCGSKVSFKKINGRGTYFCPNCQIKGSQQTLF